MPELFAISQGAPPARGSSLPLLPLALRPQVPAGKTCPRSLSHCERPRRGSHLNLSGRGAQRLSEGAPII